MYLFPDGVGVAPLAFPAPFPEAGLHHPGRSLEVVVDHLKVPERWEGRIRWQGPIDDKLDFLGTEIQSKQRIIFQSHVTMMPVGQ